MKGQFTTIKRYEGSHTIQDRRKYKKMATLVKVEKYYINP